MSHTGKLYTVAAQLLANALVRELPEITEARCLILSRIGTPVRRPHLVDVSVRTGADTNVEVLRPHVQRIVDERLEALETLWRDLVTGTASALMVP